MEQQQRDRKGVQVNPGENVSPPYDWANLGSLATGISTPSVTARDRTSMSALVTANQALELLPPDRSFSGYDAVYPESNGAVNYEIRMRSSGENDEANVADILTASGPLASEHYTRRARITGTRGTQLYSGSIYFVDKINGTLEAWIAAAAEINPSSPNNYIGSYVFKVNGAKSLIFVPITIPSGILYIDYRRFT